MPAVQNDKAAAGTPAPERRGGHGRITGDTSLPVDEVRRCLAGERIARSTSLPNYEAAAGRTPRSRRSRTRRSRRVEVEDFEEVEVWKVEEVEVE